MLNGKLMTVHNESQSGSQIKATRILGFGTGNYCSENHLSTESSKAFIQTWYLFFCLCHTFDTQEKQTKRYNYVSNNTRNHIVVMSAVVCLLWTAAVKKKKSGNRTGTNAVLMI